MARWVQIALVLLALVAVVAVGAFVFSVVDAHNRNSHQATCSAYHDALVVAYSDPLATTLPTGLNKADTAAVAADRARYQAAYEHDTQSSHDTLPGGITPLFPSTDQALANQKHAAELANWRAYVDQAIPVLMAKRGC